MLVSWQSYCSTNQLLGLELHEALESDVHSLSSAGCKWWHEEFGDWVCVDFIWHTCLPFWLGFEIFVNVILLLVYIFLVSPFFLSSTSVCLSCGFISLFLPSFAATAIFLPYFILSITDLIKFTSVGSSVFFCCTCLMSLFWVTSLCDIWFMPALYHHQNSEGSNCVCFFLMSNQLPSPHQPVECEAGCVGFKLCSFINCI